MSLVISRTFGSTDHILIVKQAEKLKSQKIKDQGYIMNDEWWMMNDELLIMNNEWWIMNNEW